ncbi:MAG: DNA primase [Bacilli bacterium]|nr:DNA primase [Bacilli bacterium]
MYSQELIDDVLKSADIVSVISSYINVIKKGRSYMAVCPFHDDKNPSLNISPEKQIFKCFVCGTGGNAITFVQKYEKIPFDAAVRKVAELSGFSDPRLLKEMPKIEIDPNIAPLIRCIDDLHKYYVYCLNLPEGEKARQYLEKRNIPADQIQKYGIGYSPLDGANTIKYLQAKGHSLKSIEDIGIALARSNGTSDHNAGRIIFPLFDPNGQVVGFSARQLEKDGTAKYINSPDGPLFHKGKLLYNYHNAKGGAHRDGYCYLLEGFMDVFALEKASLPNAVALMGTSLTGDQIALLKRLRCEIRVCLDGDAPGQNAMMKIVSMLQRENIPFRLVDYGGDLRDPDDLLQEEGVEALTKRMNNLVDAYEFALGYYTNTRKLEKAEDKEKVLKYFLPFLANAKAGIEREDYLAKLSKATGYETEAIRRLIPSNDIPHYEESEDAPVYITEPQRRLLHPENKLFERLYKAEREILYYMLSQMDAIKYFESDICHFLNKDYEEIANYILDYVSAHDEPAHVSNLLGVIASSGKEDASALNDVLSDVALDNFWPPYSRKSVEQARLMIEDQKKSIYHKNITMRSLEGKSQEDKVRLIAEYAKQKEKEKKK